MNNYLKELKEDRFKRIEERKKYIKSKKNRKLMKYSDNYNEMFIFFLKSYRKGILDFCGSDVKVKHSYDGEDGKFSFRMFDNGQFKNKELTSIHPNILRGVIIGKKSWGLFCQEWSQGIVSCDFTKEEILNQFKENNIKIPEVFITEFDNIIWKTKLKKYEDYERNRKI